MLTPSPPRPGGSDLVGHAGAFGLLGMLVWWNLPAGPWREVAAVVVAGLLGAATEWGQGYVAQRMPSVVDAAADVVGAGMGVAVVALLPAQGARLLAARTEAPRLVPVEG